MKACEDGGIVCALATLPIDEFCDGQDNDCDGEVPIEETEDFCRTEIVFNDDDEGPQPMRIEFPIALREVDVIFNIDTTGSMSGALQTLRTSLRTEIVPGIAAVIPSAAFGVSTFEDYPMHGFGGTDDLPFELRQRITTRVDLVQSALADISLGSGADVPESGIESLYQLATGFGTRWPRRTTSGTVDPSSRRGLMGEIDPAGEVDFYRFSASPGTFVSIDVDAAEVGSSLDGYLQLYDATGLLLAYNDDADGLDPSLNLALTGTPPYFVKVSPYRASGAGWYHLQVLVGGDPVVPAEDSCSELEVGDDVFAGTGSAISLLPFDDVTPRADAAGCFVDCRNELEAPESESWIRSFCFAGGVSSCGDGTVDTLEECDDGNSVSGDGCSSTCSLETEGVPRFVYQLGFDPSLGHGIRGGAGYRENALPIIVHATDAISHHPSDYIDRNPGIEAHPVDETFFELDKLGARIIGIASGTSANASIDDLLNPPGMAYRTGARVPPCAFDGSEVRVDNICDVDECCTGPSGDGRPADSDGMCTLSFDMGGNGSGLTDGVVLGIQALAEFATYRVTPILRNDPNNARDGRCFVQSVEVAEVIQPDECVPELQFDDRDDDGFFESIQNATPRTQVIYEFVVENRDARDFDGDLDTFEPCGPQGTYRIFIDVVGDDVAVLASSSLMFTIEE